MSRTIWLTLGSILGALGVAAGTFGAHGLEGHLEQLKSQDSKLVTPERRLEVYRTGVAYHQIHALAMLAVGLAAQGSVRPSKAPLIAGTAFLLGILLFSGSLYAMGVTGYRWLGMITPLGGVSFLAGWAAMAAGTWPRFRS